MNQMKVRICQDAATVARVGASMIVELVRENPAAVLGLATGSTPPALYQELIRRHKEEGLSFSQVTTFNLDEYVGLWPTHKQSYHFFMWENLFRHINIDPRRVFIPAGIAPDMGEYCEWYENAIRSLGGIDLQVLGIGPADDPHIAFNCAGTSLTSRTHVVNLHPATIKANARFFPSAVEVPRQAITMGVQTIMEVRQCLLLITGSHKAVSAVKAIEGPITVDVTASVLQNHPNTVVLLDEPAASKLKRIGQYELIAADETTVMV